MSEPLISVIVPVYKCEKYLESCIKSILAQTYTNLEILLIDDGSPDTCPAICDAFAERDERVRVFHKINGGASSARNMGLDHANGAYICFVDSDDILPQNAVMDLWRGITDNSCQYAAGICGILNGRRVENNVPAKKIIDYAENPLDLLNYITQGGSYSPYAKIYDTSVIQKHQLRYDEALKCSEDALFIRQYLSYCSRIVLIPTIVYKYNTENDESLSKKFFPDFCLYYAKKMEALEDLVREMQIPESKKRNFIFDRAVHGLYISIRHYLMRCVDREQTIFLIGKAIDVMDKWIKAEGESVTHEKWWCRYAGIVQNRDAEKIWLISQREIKWEYRVQRLKQNVKKIIRGTGK